MHGDSQSPLFSASVWSHTVCFSLFATVLSIYPPVNIGLLHLIFISLSKIKKRNPHKKLICCKISLYRRSSNLSVRHRISILCYVNLKSVKKKKKNTIYKQHIWALPMYNIMCNTCFFYLTVLCLQHIFLSTPSSLLNVLTTEIASDIFRYISAILENTSSNEKTLLPTGHLNRCCHWMRHK